MALMHARVRMGAAIAGMALASACTVHKQDTPSLTGPSELGTSITVAASPDLLTQDGASQSVITITARNNNGQPLPNLSLRVDIGVGGTVADFGRLSARNVVTDSSGRATLIYTAPPAPAIVIGGGITVDIMVTPMGTNFDNSNTRVASIRLTPPGVITLPPSPLRPEFVPPSPTVGSAAVFTATVVDATGADATNQVSSFAWDFGDGGSASGKTVTHTFFTVANFVVSLTITDSLGRVQTVSHTVPVGQGQLPVASFVASPASPIVNQQINFNGTGSTAEPGHRIVSFAWNFGDGTFGSGDVVTHAFSQAGTFTVTLQVTDDAGRKSALATQTITVGSGNPSADFTFNPSAPRSGQNVTFDGSPSQAFGGRTIVSWSWSFGDGGSGSGQVVTHTFNLPSGSTTSQTFNVLLTVTDSSGRTGSITKPITVNP